MRAFVEAGGCGYPDNRMRGVWGRFRGIFARVRPFENGTMIKGGTPNGAPPTHKAPQRGSFQISGKVHIFKKLKILGERRAAKCPCFKGFGGSPIFRRGDDRNNVWTPVIAIQRSDAERLGYDSADSWRSLICSEIDQIAKAYKILPSHLKWYAAFHEKARSVHVHLVIFSTDPNEGYLTKPAILELRSALTRQIFKDDLKNIYVQQTAYRDQLQENALAVMESLIQKMQDGELVSPKLELLITELAERLQNYSGKKVYGYLPPATKRIVDAIVDELAGDERVADAYSLWQDMRDEVFSFYSKAKPERVPLSQQKEFKPVRNMVIREVVQMMEELQSENVEYPDGRQQAVPELETVSESSAPSSTHSTPPTPEHRVPPPEFVAACMVRMLHHMGNIFRDTVGASGYRGLQLDRKRRKELQEWKIALGHREDDHEDSANYPRQVY